MSFLDQNFDDVSEPKSVKEGEYQVRVLDAAVKTSQKGKGDYVNLRLEILDDPQAKDINHVMMIPGPGDDAKQRNKRLFAIQSFLKACGFDPATTENVQEVIGATCWAILVEEQDPEYGTQNRVRKFVTGK